jgi:hypothetical protein
VLSLPVPGLAPCVFTASVVGKMIDARSIVVAGVATGQEGGEGQRGFRYAPPIDASRVRSGARERPLATGIDPHADPSARAAARAARARVARLTLAAAALFGTWAFAANARHGGGLALRAAAVQALSSATTTLVISGGIEALARWLAGRRGGLLLVVLVPPSASSSVHLLAHLANGTPEVLRTIAPSVLMGYAFAALYALGLRRARATAARGGAGRGASR